MNDAFLSLAALGLLGVPVLGAVLLWLLPRARGGARLAITLPAVALLGAGLVGAVGAMASQGATGAVVPLGAAEPHQAIASVLWTLATVALSGLFVVIALRARSAGLLGLAVLQAAVAVPSATRELVSGPPERAGAGLLLDPLSLALLMVSVTVGGLIVVYSLGYEPEHLHHAGLDERRTNQFLAWLLVFLASMHLLVLADDLQLLAVGWEITTLCSYLLIGFDRTPEATDAARRALAYNLFGGAALAAAIWTAGSNATMSELLTRPQGGVLALVVAGMAVAAATKSALAPFHPWLLGAMVAAAPVSALLHASTMVKAGSYLLLRLSPLLAGSSLGLMVAILGGFSFAMAALLALRERDLKRVLALSTVASLGLIAAAAGMGSPVALAAGIVFLLLHAFAKGLAFLVIGATEQATGTRDLESLVGLGRARPRLAGPFILAAAAMALPPFGIAATKWALLVAGSADLPVVILLAVGAATNVALWTAVVARMLVRRPVDLPRGEPRQRSVRLSVAGLSIGTVAGLLVAGPLAAALGDPAAVRAFGHAGPLAGGLDLRALGGVFPVLPLVVAGAALAVVAAMLVRRLQINPEPYLGGTNVSVGQRPAFHGPRGDARLATSGGFYWGAALGGGDPFATRQFVAVGGWLLIGAVAALALLLATGWVL